MKQYRKKPVVIEAIRYDGDNFAEIETWANKSSSSRNICELVYSRAMLIKTLEGEMKANVGDWIIKGVKGEFYPCKPDVFAATYEPIEPTTNCSQLEQAFRAYEVGLKLESKRWLVRNQNDTVMGFITEEDEGFRPIDDSPTFTPLELRQLADLVEATLKGGE